MKKKLCVLFLSIFAVFLFTGCGSNRELEAYRQTFDTFCTEVARIDSAINALDPQAEDATATLLSYLDELNVLFQNLASTEMPEELSYMENLAQEAGEHMGHAVEHYHLFYEAEEYDADTLSLASQYYERAYKRVQYMITFLHGETPDDENVQVIEE